MILEQHQVLSLDLWDTVLRRRCHPDSVKLYTAQQMALLLIPWLDHRLASPWQLLELRQKMELSCAQDSIKKGLDDEFRLQEVLARCLEHLVGTRVDSVKKNQLLQKLIEIEIRQEIRVSFPDPHLITILQSLAPKRIILLSDFYMSADAISRILSSKALPWHFEELFLSSDTRLNKKSGRLFLHAIRQIGVAPEQMLHIGDNLHSDVKMAKQVGLTAYLFRKGRLHACRLRHIGPIRSHSTKKSNLEQFLRIQLKRHASNLPQGRDTLFAAGVRQAIPFCGFALFIQQISHIRGHNDIFFFTREGYFFQQLYLRATRQNPYGLPQAAAHLLPVSRLATFFPSLNSISLAELQRIWSQYPRQSMHSLFASLGVSASRYEKWFKRYSINPLESIYQPWRDKRIQRLFDDRDFRARLHQERDLQRKKLINFLRQQHFDTDMASKRLVVDIGWRGTIQDNLALILPHLQLDGVYLGLQPFFNPQPDNTNKYGYIANANQKKDHLILQHVIVFEMLCYGPGGSTIGYTTNGTKMVPVTDEENTNFHLFWSGRYQQGVLHGIDVLCSLIADHGITFDELRDLARKEAARILTQPNRAVADAFVALRQDDTFGMARVLVPGQTRISLMDRLVGVILASRRKRFQQILAETGWPQGILRIHLMGILYYIGQLKHVLWKTGLNLKNYWKKNSQ